MKTRNLWLITGVVGLLTVASMLILAVVTATGADYLDPTKRVNRIDFVWSAVGLVVVIFSFWRSAKLPKK